MNELEQMQNILESGRGKYLLAYRVKDNEQIQRGLPVYNDKKKAKRAAKRLAKDIDVIIKCWVEDRK